MHSTSMHAGGVQNAWRDAEVRRMFARSKSEAVLRHFREIELDRLRYVLAPPFCLRGSLGGTAPLRQNSDEAKRETRIIARLVLSYHPLLT